MSIISQDGNPLPPCIHPSSLYYIEKYRHHQPPSLELGSNVNPPGLSYATSPSTTQVGAVRSGLQKACRRGNIDDMMMCMVEMMAFAHLKRTPSFGMISNMCNRLRVSEYGLIKIKECMNDGGKEGEVVCGRAGGGGENIVFL